MNDFFSPPDVDITLIVVIATVVTVMLNLLPDPLRSVISYPIRFSATVIHELSHGIAALMTGGEFIQFDLSLDTSGVAWSRGGWKFLIIPAGYLGTALTSAVLILFTGIKGAPPFVLGGLGGVVIILVFVFGRGKLTTFLGGYGVGALAIVIAMKCSDDWILFALSLFAIHSGLQVLTDLRGLRFFNQRGTPTKNDAADMAEYFGCMATIWAWLWTIISLTMIGFAFWFIWFRTM